MQAPSSKVTAHALVAVLLQVAVFLAKDTSWLGWLPDPLQPFAPIVAQLLAAIVAYYKAENRPSMSALAAFRRQQ
jgi:hypothetical protein